MVAFTAVSAGLVAVAGTLSIVPGSAFVTPSAASNAVRGTFKGDMGVRGVAKVVTAVGSRAPSVSMAGDMFGEQLVR